MRVTTDQGLTYESRKLIFKNDTVIPLVTVTGASAGFVDGSKGDVTISGSVNCSSGVGSLGYRIFTAKAVMDEKGLLKSLEPITKSEITPLKEGKSFSIPFNATNYGAGIYFIEVIATSIGGNVGATAICVKNIPELPAGTHRIKSVRLHYSKEAPFGDTITIFRAKTEDGKYLFKTVKENGEMNIACEVGLIEL